MSDLRQKQDVLKAHRQAGRGSQPNMCKPRGYKWRRFDVAFYAACVLFVRVLKVQMPQGQQDSADHDTHAKAHDPHSCS